MTANKFLIEKQEKRIIKAIQEAEHTTSGEIRLHIEHSSDRPPLEQAARIFHELGMDRTRFQNGVLIYIAYEDRKAAVYAGKGIHKQVEDTFWNDVLDILLNHFRSSQFEEGIITAIHKVGDKIKELFPYNQKGDLNELSDNISYHDNSK